MADGFTILRRQLAECRSNLHDTQAELAGVRRELVSARTAASSSAMEAGAAQAEIGRLRAMLEAMPCEHEAFKGACVQCGADLPPKPSESSMVQRIEALDRALRAAQSSLAFIANDREQDAWSIRAYARARAGVVGRALDGPPDPERDRETRAEVERP